MRCRWVTPRLHRCARPRLARTLPAPRRHRAARPRRHRAARPHHASTPQIAPPFPAHLTRPRPPPRHRPQLVGYGTEKGKDYWLVRNSWGTSWGESGYIKLEKFGEGKEPCGTDTRPADGFGCEGGPSSIQVGDLPRSPP